MRLYVDDDTASPLLAKFLRKAGHDVQLPADVNLRGADDPIHFKFAITDGRVFLTKNYGDFKDLHELVIAAQGHHPGVLAIRQDNDPRRDLTHRGIVRAMAKLEASGVSLADAYIVLNQWR